MTKDKNAASITGQVDAGVRRKIAESTLQILIEKAEKNLKQAIEREDYSSATKADSYLAGLVVALGVVKNS